MKPKNGFKTSSHEDAFKIMQNTTKKHPFFLFDGNTFCQIFWFIRVYAPFNTHMIG
ncbi:hypothetical protein MCBB_0511 [Methanobacterium congolense]|uniref:Uncharacterized protein n=1 Tax=Methanobacterium congolense TaxID=118062 RepID=A0A1D3L0D7_9EURY|nr:hypothetical protein MCBB_0511 [Methanobacterium congolense]